MNLELLKQKLQEEKNLLEQELSRLGVQDKKTGDWGATLHNDTEMVSDPIDLGDRDEEFALTANTLGELEIRYKEVLAALEKMKSGTYGICEISGQAIEEDRLMANPAAKTCKAHM